MKYIVYITEEHSFKVEVEANSEDDAYEVFSNGDIELGEPCHVHTTDLTIESIDDDEKRIHLNYHWYPGDK